MILGMIEDRNILRWQDGTVYRITRPTQETGGAYLEMEWELPPHGWAPAPHVHPAQTEEYEVSVGSLELLAGKDWRTLKAGEIAAIPPGTVHTFRVGASGAKVRNVHRPALDFEPYIRAQNATLNAHRLDARYGLRRLLYTALLLRRYPQSTRAATPAQNAALSVLAALARLFRMSPIEA